MDIDKALLIEKEMDKRRKEIKKKYTGYLGELEKAAQALADEFHLCA